MRMRLARAAVPRCRTVSCVRAPAGISRDSLHKRRLTGGKQKKWRKKRKCAPSPSSMQRVPPLPLSRSMTAVRRAWKLITYIWDMLRRYEMGRQPANTKISGNVSVRRVRVRGGNFKFRALRLDQGNFSWGSEVRRPCLIVVLLLETFHRGCMVPCSSHWMLACSLSGVDLNRAWLSCRL